MPLAGAAGTARVPDGSRAEGHPTCPVLGLRPSGTKDLLP